MNFDQSLLLTLFVCLLAAALAVPGAQRLGLGRAVGFLAGGFLVGPWGLALVREPDELRVLAEFATGVLLFLIGFELQPALLQRLKHTMLTRGLPFWVISTLVFTMVGLTSGLGWAKAVAVAMALALSSHALVAEFIESKNLTGSSRGEYVLAMTTAHALLFLPLLILLPLLGFGNPLAEPVGLHNVLIDIVLTVLVVAGGHWVSKHVLRYITATQAPEMFLAAVLLLVFGVLLLFIQFGSSALLGAYLAGCVMAASEFRQELASTLRPWRGLLLGFFFFSLGLSVDFGLLLRYPMIVLAVLIVMLSVKVLVALALGYLQGHGSSRPHWLSVSLLAPAGELSFVALSIAIAFQAVDRELGSGLVVVIVLSMILMPIVQILYNRRRASAVSLLQDIEENTEPNKVDGPNTDLQASAAVYPNAREVPLLIAGFGRIGQTVCRLMVSAGMEPVLVDHDPERLADVSQMGFRTYCGDALRPELLELAGLGGMTAMVIAIENHRRSMQLVSMVREHFPHVRLVVRSSDRYHQVELASAGVIACHRENYESAVLMGEDALSAIGIDWEESERISEAFRDHEARLIETEIEIGRLKLESGEPVYNPSLALGYTQVEAQLSTLLSLDNDAFERELKLKTDQDD